MLGSFSDLKNVVVFVGVNSSSLVSVWIRNSMFRVRCSRVVLYGVSGEMGVVVVCMVKYFEGSGDRLLCF